MIWSRKIGHFWPKVHNFRVGLSFSWGKKRWICALSCATNLVSAPIFAIVLSQRKFDQFSCAFSQFELSNAKSKLRQTLTTNVNQVSPSFFLAHVLRLMASEVSQRASLLSSGKNEQSPSCATNKLIDF